MDMDLLLSKFYKKFDFSVLRKKILKLEWYDDWLKKL